MCGESLIHLFSAGKILSMREKYCDALHVSTGKCNKYVANDLPGAFIANIILACNLATHAN